MNEFHFGALPDGWRKLPMRRCLLMRQNGSWGDEPVSDGDGEYCLRAADFDYPRLAFKGEGNFVRRSYGPGAFESVRLKDGDILIEKSGGGEKTPVGRAILFDDSFTAGFSNFMERQRVNAQICVPEYYFYWWTAMYQQDVFTQYIKQTTGLQNLDTGTLLSQEYMPLPPLSEQVQIARAVKSNLLDIQNATDQLCAQISTLERYKSSLIHEAVTKGLDKGVPTWPSGVEWIGDIPIEWECKSLKYSAVTGSGTTPESGNSEYYDGNVPWIQSGDLYGVDVITETKKTVTERALRDYAVLKIYRAPFVVMAMYGASTGNVSKSMIDACVNQACCVFTAGSALDPRYLYYILVVAQADLKRKALGGTQPNISQVIIQNEKIPVPPVGKQKEIADFLDDRCSRIDRILDLKRRQVDVLRRRRQSLIYEYVTGKRRVNQEA